RQGGIPSPAGADILSLVSPRAWESALLCFIVGESCRMSWQRCLGEPRDALPALCTTLAQGDKEAPNLSVVCRLLELEDPRKEPCHAPRNVSRLRRPARPRPACVQAGAGVVARARCRPRRTVAGGRPRRIPYPEPLRQGPQRP